MKFTIEAKIDIFPHRLEYRLKKDNTWRRLTQKNLEDTDLTIDKPLDTQKYCSEDQTIIIDTNIYKANPSMVFLTETVAFVRPILHRSQKPRRFTRSELEQTIATGYDELFNVLILDLEGNFALKSGINFDFKWVTDPAIAVRHEAFCPGNDYIGSRAAADKKYVQETYLAMLQGWVEHLKTGKLNIFIDEYSSSTEKALWQEVEKLTAKLP